MDCNNTNLKRGSKGDKVREAQTLLSSRGFYGGRIDGDFGSYTEEAVRNFQRSQGGLAVDGVVGPVTCRKLQGSTPTPTGNHSYYKNGIYHSGEHWVGTGCNKMGQCNSYYCGCCALRQQLTKLGIENYAQSKIASYAGTTTGGTSHGGLETAIAKISRETGILLKVEWKNFSDFGSNQRARFEGIGKLLAQQNKALIHHDLYKNRYGHYESIQEVNMNNNTCLVLNSLGSKCNSPAYCGYKETRSWNTMQSYYGGISQRSICIITSEGQTGRGEQDVVTEDIPTLVQLVTSEEKDTTHIHEVEDKQEYIQSLQEIIEEAYSNQGLTDEVLQLQVEVNKLRHEHDIHDPTEVINTDDDGEYVQ